ncbi:glycosyltransferase family 4 protein [Microbacterium sp. P06]|uniref:glycosyltransferase family 4 protein n=1 Tax=Microbacterium sp. P06 TaxID=3366949 RepID=UPI003745272D
MTDAAAGTIGYVIEVFPRLSETFIVTELNAREAQGEELAVFSLRPPDDQRRHAAAETLRAPIEYLPLPRPSPTGRSDVDTATRRDGSDLPTGNAGDRAQAILLAESARRRGVTHLHAHFAGTATTVTRLASLISGIPYSFTAHAVDIFRDSVSMPDIAQKVRDAAFVVTVSDYNRAFLERHVGHAHKIHRVYNGIDLELFVSAPRRLRAVSDGLRLLAVGRLVEKKGFALLIEAVRRVRERGGAVTLDIVGSGEREHELAEQIALSGHSDAIRLLGPLTQDDVAARLHDADVFVAPSIVAADGNADGLPTVLLEAMASGIPCISTDVTGIPEIIRPGETGLLCRGGEVDDLVAAIETTLSPGFDAASLARNARALIEREFDARRQAATLAALTAPSGAERTSG